VERRRVLEEGEEGEVEGLMSEGLHRSGVCHHRHPSTTDHLFIASCLYAHSPEPRADSAQKQCAVAQYKSRELMLTLQRHQRSTDNQRVKVYSVMQTWPLVSGQIARPLMSHLLPHLERVPSHVTIRTSFKEKIRDTPKRRQIPDNNTRINLRPPTTTQRSPYPWPILLKVLEVLIKFLGVLLRILHTLAVILRVRVKALCVARISHWRYDGASAPALKQLIPLNTAEERM
jgi:hypothetical protein